MPDKTEDENIDAILDNATIEYAKIQQEIDSLPKEKVLVPVPRPDGTKDFSEQISKAQLTGLKKQQEKVKEKVLEKANQLSVNKSPEEHELIKLKVEKWNNEDPYKRYQELLALQKNPVAIAEPAFLKLLADRKEKNESVEPKKPFSMSARWEQSLGYKTVEQVKEPAKDDSGKTQKAEDFFEVKKDITEKKKTFSMSARWEESLGYPNQDQTQEPTGAEKSVEPPQVDLDRNNE